MLFAKIRKYAAYSKNYFRETTVHGLKYVVDGSNLLERVIWTFCVLLVFVLASFMISSSLDDMRTNPILATIETVHVSAIPKPAVSVNLPESEIPMFPS